MSDGDLNVIIKSLQSVAQGLKEYKTMSAEEERQLTEKTTLRHQESLKDYDECLEQRFLEGAGEWRHRKEGEWSVEELRLSWPRKVIGIKKICTVHLHVRYKPS